MISVGNCSFHLTHIDNQSEHKVADLRCKILGLRALSLGRMPDLIIRMVQSKAEMAVDDIHSVVFHHDSRITRLRRSRSYLPCVYVTWHCPSSLRPKVYYRNTFSKDELPPCNPTNTG